MMGPIGCPETSIINYHYSLHNNPEEGSSDLLRGGSLKSRITRTIVNLIWCNTEVIELRVIRSIDAVSATWLHPDSLEAATKSGNSGIPVGHHRRQKYRKLKFHEIQDSSLPVLSCEASRRHIPHNSNFHKTRSRTSNLKT